MKKTTAENAFASKLTAAKAAKVRERVANDEPIATIASELGVSPAAIRAVVEYRSYCPDGVTPVVVPVPSDLVTKAREAGLSLEAICKKALTEALRSAGSKGKKEAKKAASAE